MDKELQDMHDKAMAAGNIDHAESIERAAKGLPIDEQHAVRLFHLYGPKPHTVSEPVPMDTSEGDGSESDGSEGEEQADRSSEDSSPDTNTTEEGNTKAASAPGEGESVGHDDSPAEDAEDHDGPAEGSPAAVVVGSPDGNESISVVDAPKEEADPAGNGQAPAVGAEVAP